MTRWEQQSSTWGEEWGWTMGTGAKRCREEPCVKLGKSRPSGPNLRSAGLSAMGTQALRLEGPTPESEGASPS